jgi:hypothetical protein
MIELLDPLTNLVIAGAFSAVRLIWDGVWFAIGFSIWYWLSGQTKKV